MLDQIIQSPLNRIAIYHKLLIHESKVTNLPQNRRYGYRQNTLRVWLLDDTISQISMFQRIFIVNNIVLLLCNCLNHIELRNSVYLSKGWFQVNNINRKIPDSIHDQQSMFHSITCTARFTLTVGKQ